jgi:hypothetical protein
MTREADLMGGVPAGMVQIDAVLPSQFFAARHRQPPEQQLMIAVLHDALGCLEKHRVASNRPGRRLFQETLQWLLAEETAWPYSFESICGVLGLDANAVRQRVLASAGWSRAAQFHRREKP